MRFVVFAAAVLALGGCQSAKNRETIETAQAASRDCDTRTFKTAVARAECKNAAMEQARGAADGRGDLLTIVQTKRLVFAERVDKGQMTQAEANAEMAVIMSSAGQEEIRRDTVARAETRARYRAAADALGEIKIVAPPVGAPPQSVTCTSKPFLGNVQTTCQ